MTMKQEETYEQLTGLKRDIWQIRAANLEPGTYVLQEDVPNHKVLVDKRHKTDWRHFEGLPSGEYIVEEVSDKYDFPFFRMWRNQRNGSLYDVTCRDWRFWVVIDNAAMAADTPSRLLTRERDLGAASDILDKLHETGKLSIEDLKTALESIRKDWEG